MIKWLMWAVIAVLLALGLGFWSFAERVRQAAPDPRPRRDDMGGWL